MTAAPLSTAGNRVLRVEAHRVSDGSSVIALSGPLDIQFTHVPTGVIPSTSEDGVTWTPVSELASDQLPDGQRDGFYRDRFDTIHLLTRHLSYFAILQAPQAHLAFNAVATVRFSFAKSRSVAARMETTTRARLTARLDRLAGKLLRTWTRPIRAGVSIVRFAMPDGARKPGTYTLVLTARAKGRSSRAR